MSPAHGVRASDASRSPAAVLLVAACLVALAGCATRVPPPVPLSDDDPRPIQWLAALDRTASGRQSLRADLRLSLDGPAGSARSQQALAVERPSRLRVEIRGFLSQTLAVLVTDGGRYDFVRAQDRHFERGAVYPELLRDVAQVELLPSEAVDLLLGPPAPQPGLRATGALGLPDGGVRVDLRDDRGGLRQVVEFGPAGRVTRVELRSPEGALRYEATFADYRLLGEGEFAHAVELHFPRSGSTVVVRFGQVELNPELPDEIFALSDPRG